MCYRFIKLPEKDGTVVIVVMNSSLEKKLAEARQDVIMKIATEERYKHLSEAFGMNHGRLWDMCHCAFSATMFKANKSSIIGEYLIWKEFVKGAKRYHVAYYQGIDIFLEEYKRAVNTAVDLDSEFDED